MAIVYVLADQNEIEAAIASGYSDRIKVRYLSLWSASRNIPVTDRTHQ